jgi:O-antigen/teichoic acid export membrane protein
VAEGAASKVTGAAGTVTGAASTVTGAAGGAAPRSPAPARTVTRNVAGMVFGRVALGAAGLVSVPIVYSRLGPTGYGIWALLGGIVAIVALVDLGLASAAVRRVAATIHDGQLRETRATLGVALIWGVVLALGAMAALVAVWPSMVRVLNLGPAAVGSRPAALGLLLGLLFDGVGTPWRVVLEGCQRYTVVAWTTGASALLAAALAILVVRLGGGLAELSASVAATSALRTAAVITTARRHAPAMSPRLRDIRLADLRAIARYGLRVQVTTASGAVNLELDRFVLSGFFGPAVAGGFELGGKMVNLLRMPPAFVLVALFPMAVTRTARFGSDWLDRFNLTTTRYLLAFTGVGAAVLVVCADPLVRLWLGQPMWWAAANIAILAPSYAVNLASGGTSILTRVEGRPGRESGYAVLSVVTNLALTWPLLRWWGPVGVPVATSIGIALSTVYFVANYHWATGRPIAPMLRAVRSPVLATIAGGVAGALLAPYLPDGTGRWAALVAVATRATVVVAVTVAVLAATRFVDADDRARLARLVRRTTTGSPIVAGGAP